MPIKNLGVKEGTCKMSLRSIGSFLILLMLAICVPAQTPQPSPQASPQPSPQPSPKPSEKTKYDLLLEKVKQKDPSVNFTELRLAFFESPNYNPYAPMLTYRPMNAALNQKNYEEALKIAEAVLAKNFVEINAHITAQIAYQETGNAERAQFHKFMVDGLLNSIKSNFDGKSAATAFEVISINEEYGLVRSLGLRPIKQALIEDKGHSYDAITVVDPQTNQQSIIYFNIDKPFSWKPKP
jgi:tetratricopeptide (TPR) repeat protein